MSMNRVTIMGRLTKDPELRRTGNGIAVVSFSIAVERDHSSKEDGTKETDFFYVTAWRSTAEFAAKYLSKGRMIGVDGRLQSRSYEDKNGNRRDVVEIMADRMYFADSNRDNRPSAGTTGAYQPEEPTNFAEMSGDDEELPF